MTYLEFIKILKNERIKNKLTQKDVSEKLFISLSFYNKIENGKLEPNFELLMDIISLFNIDLLFIIKNKKPKMLFFD